jgi:drug/metabolite transporter (DMT)-like permease
VLGLGLALSASLGWGVADFIGGLQARRLPLLYVMLLSQGIALAVLIVVVAVAGHGPPRVERLWPAAAGGLAGIAGLAAFYRALAIGTMSIVAPIAATGVSLPVIVGIADGERPAALQLVGIAAAIAGVVLVSREPDRDDAGRRVARTSVLLAVLAAIGFGALAVGLRSSARADVLWALVAARGAGWVAVATAFLAWGVPRRHDVAFRSRLPVLAAMGTLDLGAEGLYALATRHGLLSVVAVAASLYPLATVILARSLLGERVRRIQELGIVAAVAGIALIAAG